MGVPQGSSLDSIFIFIKVFPYEKCWPPWELTQPDVNHIETDEIYNVECLAGW